MHEFGFQARATRRHAAVAGALRRRVFLLIMALAIYRLGDRSLASSLGSTPGIAFVLAWLAFLAAAVIISLRQP
jgi:hypothetical protein